MQYTQLDFAPHSSKRQTLVEQAGFLVREIVLGRVHPFPCTCGACIAGQLGAGEKPGSRRFSKRTVFLHFIRANMFTAALAQLRPTRKGEGFDGRLREWIKWQDRLSDELKSKARAARLTAENKRVDDLLPLDKKRLKELLPDGVYEQWEKERRCKERRRWGPDWKRKGPDWKRPGALPPVLTTDVLANWLRRWPRKKALEMIRELARREKRRDVQEFLAGFLINRDFYTYYKRAGSEELKSRVTAVRERLLTMTDRGLSRRRPAPAPRPIPPERIL